ncbi:MAG: HAD family phosphatase [Sedimentisphaerales bacterium]|jgi:HAD superfamily hydrolase (TIGR01509 family)
MLRAVIFDFDGVLVDSEKLHLAAFNSVLSKYKIQISTSEYFENLLGLSDRELLEVINNRERNLALTDRQFKQLLLAKADAFKNIALNQAAVYAGVPEFLKMLADNKIPLAICSGALLAEIEMLLKGANLQNYFDCVVSAEQVKKGKPDPEGFLLALKLLNKKSASPIKPGECIVIEDSRWGLEAAKNARMHPVAVTNTYSAEQLKPADKIVANLSELTLTNLQTLCR